MGVWLRGYGRLEVIPEPEDWLIYAYVRFSAHNNPDSYERMGESFINTWFFDKDKKLACVPGKFAEPIVWMEFLVDRFFTPLGYRIEGDMDIIGEGDSRLWDEGIDKEYEEWQEKWVNRKSVE